MVRRTASFIALGAVLAASPALADETMLMADASSSKSRADVRHDTSGDEVVATTSARSKSRRATRHENASESVAVTQNRGKRSRRNPGKEDLEAPMIATNEPDANGLIALAANTDLLAARIQQADFSGEAGALVVYQLVGKSVADMPLTDAEKHALKTAIAGTDVAALIAETEARLTEAALDGEVLEDIAKALGVPRPVATPGMTHNLGASLDLETSVSPA